jgi:hypothetical protein
MKGKCPSKNETVQLFLDSVLQRPHSALSNGRSQDPLQVTRQRDELRIRIQHLLHLLHESDEKISTQQKEIQVLKHALRHPVPDTLNQPAPSQEPTATSKETDEENVGNESMHLATIEAIKSELNAYKSTCAQLDERTRLLTEMLAKERDQNSSKFHEKEQKWSSIHGMLTAEIQDLKTQLNQKSQVMPSSFQEPELIECQKCKYAEEKENELNEKILKLDRQMKQLQLQLDAETPIPSNATQDANSCSECSFLREKMNHQMQVIDNLERQIHHLNMVATPKDLSACQSCEKNRYQNDTLKLALANHEKLNEELNNKIGQDVMVFRKKESEQAAQIEKLNLKLKELLARNQSNDLGIHLTQSCSNCSHLETLSEDQNRTIETLQHRLKDIILQFEEQRGQFFHQISAFEDIVQSCLTCSDRYKKKYDGISQSYASMYNSTPSLLSDVSTPKWSNANVGNIMFHFIS